MRFRTSKISAEEKNWSVILNPLRNELDRKRVAEKIASLFHLSFDEARELVESTPVILLDDLSHDVARQAQTIFQDLRADVTLTSDSLVKRRCFRAVWPEPPQLDFLEALPSFDLPEKAAEETPPDPIVPAAPLVVSEDVSVKPAAPPSDLEKRYRELEQLCEARNQELEGLKRNLEKGLPWEERYANLKEEYQETKAIFEEKILAREKEFDGLKAQLKDLGVWQEKAAFLERQVEELMKRMKDLESAKEVTERTLKERSEEVGLWREKYHTLAQKSERFESLYEEEHKRREKTEDASRQSAEAAEQAGREIEIQKLENERLIKRSQELTEAQKRLERDFSELSEGQEAELKRLREENQSLAGQLEMSQRQVREFMLRIEQQELIEKRTRLANELGSKEARLRELILEGDRLRQEIQDRELQAQSLMSEQANLEREILEVKQAQRHLLEQNKAKEKPGRLKRPGQEHE